jgi:hypothetical protein
VEHRFDDGSRVPQLPEVSSMMLFSPYLARVVIRPLDEGTLSRSAKLWALFVSSSGDRPGGLAHGMIRSSGSGSTYPGGRPRRVRVSSTCSSSQMELPVSKSWVLQQAGVLYHDAPRRFRDRTPGQP